MSCETWQELVEQGDLLLCEDSRERLAAQRHFRSCPSCAERAYLLDPGWAVRRSVTQMPGEAEIAELKRSILAAGRTRELESAVRGAPSRVRVAAAIALFSVVIAAGALIRVGGPAKPTARVSNTENVAVETVPASVAATASAFGTVSELSLPAIGSLAPSAARVYDLGQEDFALVMVVHETLDL